MLPLRTALLLVSLDVEVHEKDNECEHVTYLEVQPSSGEAAWPYDC